MPTRQESIPGQGLYASIFSLFGGLVQGGRHIAVDKGTPMSNLLLAGLNLLGVPATRFGDSTGPLEALVRA